MNKLYTIFAIVKIKQSRFEIQRVIEEKDERLANIEYDRTIKKEFGKPKSMTKRTLKEYTNGDKEFCKKVEEVTKVYEESEEMKELNKKIELLSGDFFGLYKVELKGNFSPIYVYAQEYEDVEIQLDFVARKNNSSFEEMKPYIRSTTRMTSATIKTDKNCLKKLNGSTVENIQEMYDAAKEVYYDKITSTREAFKDLVLNKGFNLYITKSGKKSSQTKFVIMARSSDEANRLTLIEPRFFELAHRTSKKTDLIVNVGKVADKDNENGKTSFKEIVKSNEVFEDFLNVILKPILKKEDHNYALFDGNMTAKNYVKFVEKSLYAMDKIDSGKGDELLEEKNQEIKETLKNFLKDKGAKEKFAGSFDTMFDEMEKMIKGTNTKSIQGLLK